MNWEKTTIGEHCTVTSSKRFHLSERSTSGVPFYCSKEIIQKVNGHEIIECDYIREELYEQVKKQFGVPKTGDLLITTRGTYGVPYIYSATDRFYFADGNLTWLKDFDKKLLPEFLLYWVKSHEGQGKIDAIAKGTAQKAVPIISIKALEIPLPQITQQKRIIDILSAYDNLIENNQKQIKLLEEAAQRLHKEWFVDLRFPGYETTPVVDGVPEGWELCHLEDVIEFNPKVPLSKERLKQSVPMSALSTSSMTLDTEEFAATFSNSGSKFQNGDTLLARITPCLENGKTAFVAGVESDEGAVGSTEFIVMRSKGINPYMVYLLARNDSFRQSAINSMTGSDGRQRAQADKLKALPYLKPADQIMMLFARYVEPMFIQIQKKNEQNVRLRQARDRLLPKLMSGEVEV